jgi:hypothetical protein
MFFDFKKAPNIKATLKAEVDPEEFTLKLGSRRAFPCVWIMMVLSAPN